MTPKEKAEQLINLFLNKISFSGVSKTFDIKQSKICSLIVVSEIKHEKRCDYGGVDFWNLVENEINKY